MQEVVEQEKAENFRLQPLPDVFESLLSPDAENTEHTDTAVSEGCLPDNASMDEGSIDHKGLESYQSPGPSRGTSTSPDVAATSPSVAADSAHAAESPDPAAPAQGYRLLPTENFKFAFLGGYYRYLPSHASHFFEHLRRHCVVWCQPLKYFSFVIQL